MFDKLVNRLTQTTADEREAQKKAREAEVAAVRQARLDDYLDKREVRMEAFHSGRLARAKAGGWEIPEDSAQGFIGIGDSNTLGRALGTNGNGGQHVPYKAKA